MCGMNRASKLLVEPWVEWRADRIPDPVRRLRYLRATAQLKPRKTSSHMGLRVAALLLAAAGAGCFLLRARMTVAPLPEFARRVAPPPAPGFESVSEVWPVEQNHDFETYSNGLRIDTRHAVENHPRSFHRFTPPPSEQVPREPQTHAT